MACAAKKPLVAFFISFRKFQAWNPSKLLALSCNSFKFYLCVADNSELAEYDSAFGDRKIKKHKDCGLNFL